MMTVQEATRNMVQMRVALLGGMATEAGIREAYLAGLIDVKDFEVRLAA